MKKSLLALLLAMMSLFSVGLAFADEMADDGSASTEEPLPPLMEEGGN
ncbi:MAG: hypothetical protein K8Q92_01260 [Methylophilales bacterium]|nr:hypothetical protein [Methylophilales bacterium]